MNKISLFRKTGQLENAIEICDNILEENPDEFIVLYHKLRLLKKLNRSKESNEICDKILKVYPKNIEVRNELIK